MAQTKTKAPAGLPKLAGRAKAALPGADTGAGATVPRDVDPTSINTAVATYRAMNQAVATLRVLAEQQGAFSFAVFSYLSCAMSGYRATAYRRADNTFDPAGTALIESLMATVDSQVQNSNGFSATRGFDSLVETALKDVALSGGVAAELVLNTARLPDKINLIAYESLRWINKKGGRYPQQQAATGRIDLDIANFYVAEMGKGSDKAYAASFLLAAIKQVFYYAEFIEDMRRAVRVAGHTRLVFKLDYAKVAATAPAEVRADSAKLKTFLDGVRDDFSRSLEELEPEDAVVVYDLATVDGIQAKGEKADYKQIMDAIASLLATSVKTHPSIMGLRLAGSQSLSNTESLIFIKGAASLQTPVETVFSRALTLAARLYGADVYIQFKFNPIDLRPEQELEAFRTMRQQNTLQALSVGWISDDEAAHRLGYGPRPPGAPDLSGTLFYSGGATAAKAQNPTPNADPQGRSLQPDTPKHAGGASN